MKKPLLEKLIQEIATFDIDAAYKLHESKDNNDYRDKDNLDNVMPWRKTNEGFDYWHDINDKLQEHRKNYHPHRDLMIEYANDKTTKIEFLSDGKDEWKNIENPSFLDNEKYRKKPKLVKKVIEYRIYLDKKNKIHMIENKDTLPPHFLKWLGDWQKVEIEVEEND